MKFSELAQRIHGAIHSRGATHASGTNGPVPVHETSHGIRYVDVDLDGYGRLRFIEQNPAKRTQFAEMARLGHRITWIVRPEGRYDYLPCGVVDEEFTAHIHDTLRKVHA